MRAASRSASVVACGPAGASEPASSHRLAGPAKAVIACRPTIRPRSVTTPSAAPPKEPPREGPTPSGRFAWIDWYRGLACILMFQTHAYDAWTREPYRQGAYWDLARMQLGGFPARMFLMLAGVSLMLRYSGDARRGISGWPARRGAILRGLEVLGYGLAFRLAEWLLGGAHRKDLPDLLKVDILNCIGVSLVLTALLIGVEHLKGRRLPLLAGFATLAVVFLTPLIQRWPFPPWLPAALTAYFWDATPLGTFPQLPFVAYTLSGAVVGSLWLRAAAKGRLGWTLAITTAAGAILAVLIQWGNSRGYALFRPTPTVSIPAFPSSYGYRLGMCLVFAGASYAWTSLRPQTRFSPLRTLGQASLLVYVVHVEMVYGRLTWSLHHRLHPVVVTLLIVALSLLMIALAWVRVEIVGKRRWPWRSRPSGG